MAQHTPGPWVVNDFCTADGADVAVWTSNDPHTAKSICECHFNSVREIQRGEHGCHQLEAEANARLIAAAPELLEALGEVLPLIKYTDDAGWEKVKRARIAYEKAKGAA